MNVGGTFFSAAQLVCKMMKRAERGGLEAEDFYIWIYANVAKDVELETIRDTPPMLRFMLFLSERRKKKEQTAVAADVFFFMPPHETLSLGITGCMCKKNNITKQPRENIKAFSPPLEVTAVMLCIKTLR